jgi:hypothetical protein
LAATDPTGTDRKGGQVRDIIIDAMRDLHGGAYSTGPGNHVIGAWIEYWAIAMVVKGRLPAVWPDDHSMHIRTLIAQLVEEGVVESRNISGGNLGNDTTYRLLTPLEQIAKAAK